MNTVPPSCLFIVSEGGKGDGGINRSLYIEGNQIKIALFLEKDTQSCGTPRSHVTFMVYRFAYTHQDGALKVPLVPLVVLSRRFLF